MVNATHKFQVRVTSKLKVNKKSEFAFYKFSMLILLHNAKENGKSKFPHANKSPAVVDLYNG